MSREKESPARIAAGAGTGSGRRPRAVASDRGAALYLAERDDEATAVMRIAVNPISKGMVTPLMVSGLRRRIKSIPWMVARAAAEVFTPLVLPSSRRCIACVAVLQTSSTIGVRLTRSGAVLTKCSSLFKGIEGSIRSFSRTAGDYRHATFASKRSLRDSTPCWAAPLPHSRASGCSERY